MGEIWTPIIVGVLSLFGGGGLWNWVASRRKAPIDDATAITAMAEKSQGMALEYAKQVRTDMEIMRMEHDSRLNAMTNELESSRTEARLIIAQIADLWAHWYDNLFTGWPEHRQREFPPDAPLTPTSRVVNHPGG